MAAFWGSEKVEKSWVGYDIYMCMRKAGNEGGVMLYVKGIQRYPRVCQMRLSPIRDLVIFIQRF